VNRESDSGISRASEAGRTGDVDGLLELVNGTDYWGRIAATRLLGERREQRAVPLLRRNVHARDEGLRRASVKALGAIDADPESAQLIFDCGRSDDDFWVRCTAAEVLVARSDPRAVVIFANLLDDATTEPKPSFRHFRKFALRQIEALDGVAALPALERAVERLSFTERWRFRRAVRRLSNLENHP
jgi:HEAT repeat protein